MTISLVWDGSEEYKGPQRVPCLSVGGGLCLNEGHSSGHVGTERWFHKAEHVAEVPYDLRIEPYFKVTAYVYPVVGVLTC